MRSARTLPAYSCTQTACPYSSSLGKVARLRRSDRRSRSPRRTATGAEYSDQSGTGIPYPNISPNLYYYYYYYNLEKNKKKLLIFENNGVTTLSHAHEHDVTPI